VSAFFCQSHAVANGGCVVITNIIHVSRMAGKLDGNTGNGEM
jgi:hypothetical protein